MHHPSKWKCIKESTITHFRGAWFRRRKLEKTIFTLLLKASTHTCTKVISSSLACNIEYISPTTNTHTQTTLFFLSVQFVFIFGRKYMHQLMATIWKSTVYIRSCSPESYFRRSAFRTRKQTLYYRDAIAGGRRLLYVAYMYLDTHQSNTI